MATVRQSITALYEESEKSAIEGAPMLAVLQSEAVDQDARPAAMMYAEPEGKTEAPAIAARFEELRRLADVEAGSNAARQATTTDDDAGSPAGIDLTAGFDPAPPEPIEPVFETAATAENAVTENLPQDVPIIEIPAAPFGGSFDTASSPDDTAKTDTPDDLTNDAETFLAQPTLPDEPPAPAQGESLGDLDIGDIQDLVRQAWEDETAIGDAVQTIRTDDADASRPNTDTNSHDPAFSGGIEMAMEEIAAAVVQSADTGSVVDVETMKTDIIEAMRAELQAVVESDIRSIVKAAVAEAMAELPAAAPKKTSARKTAAKKVATQKTASSKSAKKVVAKAVTPKEGDES